MNTQYQCNTEFLKSKGWRYIGDRYTNGYVEIWCEDLKNMSPETLSHILESIDLLINRIKGQEQIINNQQKVLKFYKLENEVEK